MRMQPESITNDQLEKLGNTILYLASTIYEPNKTKMLKLIYLCEEVSVKRHGVPFFGVDFFAWKWGPVQTHVWENLDIKAYDEGSTTFSKFVTCTKEDAQNSRISVLPAGTFSDDEFSENDLKILSEIAEKYKSAEAKHLVDITHRAGSLWYNTVKKEEGLMEKFEHEQQSTSAHRLDFSELLEEGSLKNKYKESVDFSNFSNPLKK